MAFTRRSIAGASLLVLALAASPAMAAEIRGTVYAPGSRDIAPGAVISVQGQGATTRAGDDGTFVLRDLPAGDYTLQVDYVGLPQTTVQATASDAPTPVEVQLADSGEVEALVVTGQRAADRKAIQTKQSADSIVDVLYADDVGKLPDQNVAEAVKRLPGISIANDQGEGRYVIIRGTDPRLANVTLNGQTAPAPEPESRQVKLDDIPSALIASVEVVKSLTADRDANAIAGQVDITTLSAFDRNRFFVNGRAAYGQYDINGEHPYGGDITVGGVFGPDNSFGAVVSLNYDNRPIRSQNIQGSSNWRTVGGFVVPDDFRMRDYNLTRKRQGGVANFDWRPTDGMKLYLRTTYSKFTDDETRDQFRIEIPTAITGQTATSGTFNARGTRFLRLREEDDTTWSINGGGVFDLGQGELKTDLTFSRATKQDPLRSEYQFRTGANAFSNTYDLRPDPFQVTQAAAGNNAALFIARSVNYDHRKAQEDLTQFSLDYRLPLAIGDDSFLKAGLKYMKTDKTNERQFAAYTLSGFNLGAVSRPGTVTLFDGRYTLGPRVDYNAAEAFLASNPGLKVFDLAGSRVNNNANDYRVNEDVTAAYLMASLKFGDLTVIPGVRVERTEGDYVAKVITTASPLNIGFNTRGGRGYSDVFPGVNLRWDINPRLVVRGAVTTAIGRPNYADLPPFLSVDAGANTVGRGNPKLEPLKSVNWDFSIEYYLPGQGVVSMAFFRKDIDNPIYTEALTGPGTSGIYGGIALVAPVVTTPRNASEGSISGLELNAQSQLTFLPEPFDGFGVQASVTLVGSKVSGLANRGDTLPMFLQSDTVSSMQIFYEKYGFQARIAYAYRSAYLDTVGTSPSTDQYTDAHGAWDARASYSFNRNLEWFVEGANLNDEPWRRYIGRKDQLVEYERYGWSVKTGVQFKY